MNRCFAILLSAMATLSPNLLRASEDTEERAAAVEINNANELLRAGQVDQALERYQSIQPPHALRERWAYNQAVAMYRKQDYQAAAELFAKAAGANDADIAGPSHYNLGNCRYAQGLAMAQQDKAAAAAKLREAIEHYRDALRSRPHDADARANIELAAQLMDQLLVDQNESQDQQSQNQPQEQNQASERPQDSQPQDGQPQEGEQPDSQPQDSQPQEGEKQDSQPQEGEKQEGEQPDSQAQDSQPQEGEKQEGEQPDSQAQESQPQEGEGQNNSQQQSAVETPPQDAQAKPTGNSESDKLESDASQSTSGDSRNNSRDAPPPTVPQQPEQLQPEPETDDPSTSAGGQLSAANQSQPNLATAPKGNVVDESVMSHEEAMKMLQAIRDRDMLRRFHLQQRDIKRQLPVDRDW